MQPACTCAGSARAAAAAAFSAEPDGEREIVGAAAPAAQHGGGAGVGGAAGHGGVEDGDDGAVVAVDAEVGGERLGDPLAPLLDVVDPEDDLAVDAIDVHLDVRLVHLRLGQRVAVRQPARVPPRPPVVLPVVAELPRLALGDEAHPPRAVRRRGSARRAWG